MSRRRGIIVRQVCELLVPALILALCTRFVGAASLWGVSEMEKTAKRPPREVAAVGLGDVLASLKTGGVVVVDTRSKKSYSLGHLENAISIPSGPGMELAITEARDQLRAASLVVVYCDRASCTAAVRVHRALLARGIRHVATYDGGFEEWVAAGLRTQP